MVALLAVLFLLVPIVELYVIVQVSHHIGALNTFALIIVVGVLGAWLVKREGLAVLRRLQQQIADHQMPTNSLIDGGLILLAGALMLTPGFVSDVLGIFLLIPPTRAVVRALVRRSVENHAVVRVATAGGDFLNSRRPTNQQVWEADAWETDDPTTDSGPRPELR